MIRDDKTQHRATSSQGGLAKLLARLKPKRDRDESAAGALGARGQCAQALAGDSITQTAELHPLGLLPEALEDAGLPDGVVEIVVDETDGQGRCTLDIQSGCVSLVAPGDALPWTSISGSAAAWALALGPAGDASQLRRTGEPLLAERVIGALRGAEQNTDRRARDYSVFDCS